MLTLVDTTRNRIPPRLFEAHLQPLLLFFQSADQYGVLVAALGKKYFVHTSISNERKRVMSITEESFVVLDCLFHV